jgi:hypothetical protein
MLRLVAAGLACAFFSQTFSAVPVLADDNAAGPMRFEWRREGPPQACGPSCRTWVSATGYVTSETPREFEAFARTSDLNGAVLVLDSDGGSVLGTLALGRIIRNFNMVTTVGRTRALPPSADGAQFATIVPDSHCESMCAFLLLAGAHRYVPPQAQVLVHQIWLGKKRKTALESSYSAEELNVVQRDIGRLAQYTIEMGGNIELLERALQVPPWEPLHLLSAAELDRMRLNTVAGLFSENPPRQAPSARAATFATVGQPTTQRD